ncbi:hypothetical protein EBS43_11945 [bacterium]|nr:hypothetical protein [bacterium]
MARQKSGVQEMMLMPHRYKAPLCFGWQRVGRAREALSLLQAGCLVVLTLFSEKSEEVTE